MLATTGESLISFSFGRKRVHVRRADISHIRPVPRLGQSLTSTLSTPGYTDLS